MTEAITTQSTHYISSITSKQDNFEGVSTQDIPSQTELDSIVKDAFLSTNAPHQGCIKTFILNLIAYLTDSFGEKMSASQLNFSISHVFNETDGWEKLTTDKDAAGHEFFKKEQTAKESRRKYIIENPSVRMI